MFWSFSDYFGIVSRAMTGKNLLRLEKMIMIERKDADHLGNMKGSFQSVEIDGDDFKNADETNVVFNMGNGNAMGFFGHDEVKYTDYVSGIDGSTMFLRLSGGINSRTEKPFIVLKNENRA